MNVQEKVRKLLNQLVDDEYLLDGKKHLKTNMTFSIAFVLLLSWVNLFVHGIEGDIKGAAGSFAAAILCLLSLFLLYHLHHHTWAMYLFSAGMMIYAYYILLFCPPQSYTALLILLYPLLFCLFFGNSFAKPYLTILLLSMLIIFSPLLETWRGYGYSQDFISQFPLMFTAVFALAVFAENIRRRTSQRLLTMFRDSYESANRDQLTGLLNRRAFDDTIAREQARVRRYHTGLQLILCDIDHFKLINDQYGHLGGDLYLKFIAQLLQSQLRGEDYCFRWGGEEFLLLLPNTLPPQALLVAQRLRDVIRCTPMADEQLGEILATASFGVHAFDADLSVDENIARADKCLYLAKKNGRNRVEQG